MNCDEVFEHLTRYTPGESGNGQLARHLAGCNRCRELADLLGPPVELFADAAEDVPEDESEAWRKVWNAAAVAEGAAAQLRQHSTSAPRGLPRAWFIARHAAVLLVGVLLGGLITRDPSVSAPHAARAADCQTLLATLHDSAAGGLCPTCQQTLQPGTNLLSLCTACHLPPRDHGRSGQSRTGKLGEFSENRTDDRIVSSALVPAALERIPLSSLSPVRMSEPPEGKFAEFLAMRGQRLTQSRLKLVQHIFSYHDHFTADDLVLDASRQGIGVSRATVYRTLDRLVEAGMLRKFPIGDRDVYEHDYGYPEHDHLYCTKCKKIIEFHNDELIELRDRLSRAHHFRANSHRFVISGLCESCLRAGGSKHKLDLV
jgi:Fur family ferric uptake transcriptional regulator